MVMSRIKAGLVGETETEVTIDLSTNRVGKIGAEVLSTPSLLKLMERCSIAATDHLLPEDYTSVGYAVDAMRHVAPAPIGSRVRVKAVVTEVDRNRITYSIEANQGDTKIGVALHKRAIISKETGKPPQGP